MTDKETAALAALHRIYIENGDAMKNFADLEAWEAYCEASLNLSNQDDVGEDAPWLDCAVPLCWPGTVVSPTNKYLINIPDQSKNNTKSEKIRLFDRSGTILLS